jgi:hypothetical protein
MLYTMLIYDPPLTAAQRGADIAEWPPYVQALRAASVFSAGGGLQPAETATTLRHQAHERLVQDGPYADTKEQLGGFIVFDVPDLDAALDWAARAPRVPGRVLEVRPNLPTPAQPA